MARPDPHPLALVVLCAALGGAAACGGTAALPPSLCLPCSADADCGGDANRRFKNLAAMTPDAGTGVATTGYVLADVGQEYVVFAPTTAAFTVKQLQPNEVYDYQWFDSATGLEVGAQQSVTPTGTTRSFTAAGPNSVLHVWKRS